MVRRDSVRRNHTKFELSRLQAAGVERLTGQPQSGQTAAGRGAVEQSFLSAHFASTSHKQAPAELALRIVRLREVLVLRGRSRSSHYNDVQRGLFTAPVHVGDRAVGWPAYEVAALNAARVAGKPDHAIRELVKQLEAARKSAV